MVVINTLYLGSFIFIPAHFACKLYVPEILRNEPFLSVLLLADVFKGSCFLARRSLKDLKDLATLDP